jgi:putative FmdB family regulatory protein
VPTYDYKCDACGHAFEQFQSMSAAPVRKCPKCGKLKVKRLIGTGAGLIFKGSGFYITDYRDQAYKDKAKAESGSTDGAAAKPEKPAETSSTSSNGDASTSTTKAEPAKTGESVPKPESKPAKKGGKKS